MSVTEDAAQLSTIAAGLRQAAAAVAENGAAATAATTGVSLCVGNNHVALNDITQTASHTGDNVNNASASLHALADQIDALARYLLGGA